LKQIIPKEYYEGPKILADVFEAILGAVFVDGGYNEVVRVLEHILGPLVCMVAKYFDKIRKNPVEEFNLFASRNNMTPKIETYGIGARKDVNVYDTSDDEEINEFCYPEAEQPENMPFVNYKCVIIYQGKKIL